MEERGVSVDYSTVNRWVTKYSPQFEQEFHRRKRPVWTSWRMDETYIKVKSEWRYLSRAVDKYGKTIDFLLTKQRDKKAARHFLNKAICRHGVPAKITINGSDANAAAIKSYNEDYGRSIKICQIIYINNIVEQDHRGVKRHTRPILGFQAFDSAQSPLIGIELMHMIKKRQRTGMRLWVSVRPISSTPRPRSYLVKRSSLNSDYRDVNICDGTVHGADDAHPELSTRTEVMDHFFGNVP